MGSAKKTLQRSLRRVCKFPVIILRKCCLSSLPNWHLWSYVTKPIVLKLSVCQCMIHECLNSFLPLLCAAQATFTKSRTRGGWLSKHSPRPKSSVQGLSVAEILRLCRVPAECILHCAWSSSVGSCLPALVSTRCSRPIISTTCQK